MERLGPAGIVSGVKAGDPHAGEQLYLYVCSIAGERTYKALGGKVPEGGDDCLNETYLAVLKMMRRGAVRFPAALSGYIRTINRRTIRDIVRRRGIQYAELHPNILDKSNPERDSYSAERRRFLEAALAELNDGEREILIRYYLQEQEIAKICEEMELTRSQFHNSKFCAKDKLKEIAKRKLAVTAGPGFAA